MLSFKTVIVSDWKDLEVDFLNIFPKKLADLLGIEKLEL